MNLSNQALGAIMMCLQKGLVMQTDITEILRNLEFYEGENKNLYVENPPTFKVSEASLNSKTLDGTGGSD